MFHLSRIWAPSTDPGTCTVVQRFDSRLIPLDGPSGLMYKARRLLDTSARGLDAKKKQEFIEKLERVVQHPR